MQNNEFLRDKPIKKRGFGFSIIHKTVPLVSAFCVVQFCTQKCAALFLYDPAIVGTPWFLGVNGFPVYYPFLLPLLIIKHVSSGNAKVGAIINYCAMLMVIGIFSCVMLYFVLSWSRNLFNKYKPLYGTARWGNKTDLKANGLLESSGVVLGQLNSAVVDYKIADGAIKLNLKRASQLVQHPGKTSTIFFAPTRSGKGISSVIPSHLNYQGSIISIDPKGENYNLTAGYRSKFSHIYRFSPVSRDTLKFNILDEISSVDNAFRDASMIAQILVTPHDGKVDGSSRHWIETAKDLLAGVILHVKCSDYPDKSLHGVLTFLSQGEGEKEEGKAEQGKYAPMFKAMLNAKHCDLKIHEIISNVARANLGRPDNEEGSVISTAITGLQIFKDPLIEYATSMSDFCLNDFQVSDAPISLYITCPFADLERLSGFIRLLVTFILNRFSQGEAQFGEVKLKNPILFIIDEFPTLGAFPVLENFMGILAGYGITFFLICQSLTQIIKLYGENNPMLDHCRVMATYAMNDMKSAELFSKMIGIESVENTNMSHSGSRYDFGMNNLNVSEQAVQRNLINADELMHLPANQMIVFCQGMPATVCKKNVYYSDPRFKDKVKMKKPDDRKELLLECKNTTAPDPRDMQWYHIPAEEYLQSNDMETAMVFMETLPTDEELKAMNIMEQSVVI